MRSLFKSLWTRFAGKRFCADMDSLDCSQHHMKSRETPMKWKSANSHYHESPKSSLLFTAQTRSYEKRIKNVRKVKNPFEPEDPVILEENTCSPGILIPGKEPESFSWSIDEISRIQPANIDSPQFVPEEYDEGKESMAQEAIEKYFSSTHSIVSPAGAYQGTWRSPAFSTPTAQGSAKTISSTPTAKCRVVQKSEAGSQTVYSFPSVLPPEVEEILKPYFSEVYVQGNVGVDSEDQLLNTSTLRRKLFFNKGDEDLSPVKFTCRHFTPSPQKSRILSRTEWSSEKRKSRFDEDIVPSSPDLSPIKTKNDIEMTLGSPDISSISNAEVSMVTIGSTKGGDEMEDMVVSMEDHNRIFSSTVMPSRTDRFPGGAVESGYASISIEASSANFFRPDVGY